MYVLQLCLYDCMQVLFMYVFMYVCLYVCNASEYLFSAFLLLFSVITMAT